MRLPERTWFMHATRICGFTVVHSDGCGPSPVQQLVAIRHDTKGCYTSSGMVSKPEGSSTIGALQDQVGES